MSIGASIMPDYSDKELGYNDHGGPYDRGGADSYYRRSFDPHYWPDGTGFGVRIDITDRDSPEWAAYKQGYDDNESIGDYKDWG